jgi:tetratricopeptide (TPR) repeat protein
MAMRYGVLALILALGLIAPARAENEGQADLDKATQAKLDANTISDLGDVITLVESAMKKGLDAANTEFAKQLLASTRVQRGSAIAQTVLGTVPPDPRWRDFRRIALDDLEKGVEMDPNQPQALVMIAQLNLLPGGDSKRVKKALDEAVERSVEQPDVRVRALLLRAGSSDDPAAQQRDFDTAVEMAPNRILPLTARARFLRGQDKFDKALEDIDAALKLEPDNLLVLEERAGTLIDLKRYDDALADLGKIRQANPNASGPLLQLARAHGLKGDFKAALDDLNEADRIDPGNVAVLLLRSSVYESLDQRDKALADVDTALKLRPGFAEAMRLRAILLAGKKAFGEAIAQMEQLQRIRPADEETQQQMAVLYHVAQRPRKALVLYDKILTDHPDNLPARRGRADALLAIGKQAEAIADYERILKAEPEDTGVLNNLSWVLSTSPNDKIRDGKRALELATKACELTKYQQGHIVSTLAAAYAELGDFESARKWSAKAVEIGTEDQKADLRKELETYEANKQTREIQNIAEPEDGETPLPGLPEKPAEPKPADKPNP